MIAYCLGTRGVERRSGTRSYGLRTGPPFRIIVLDRLYRISVEGSGIPCFMTSKSQVIPRLKYGVSSTTLCYMRRA